MQLTMLIGIPGSGKSTYAQTLGKPVLSLDGIRQELYGDERELGSARETDRVLRERLEKLARAGEDAVLDATHVSAQRRSRMIRLARRLGYDRIVGVWFRTPIGVCLKRNRERPNALPDFVLFKMQKDLNRQPPAVEEGFDELIEIAGPGKKAVRGRGWD